MSELLGMELAPNIFDILSRRMTTVIMATIDDGNRPHTAPFNQVTAVEPGSLRMAIDRGDATFQFLCRNGLAMVEILEEGDIAIGIQCRAQILREKMSADSNLAVVEFAIEGIKHDNSAHYVVTQGIRTRHRDEPFPIRQRQIMAELKS